MTSKPVYSSPSECCHTVPMFIIFIPKQLCSIFNFIVPTFSNFQAINPGFILTVPSTYSPPSASNQLLHTFNYFFLIFHKSFPSFPPSPSLPQCSLGVKSSRFKARQARVEILPLLFINSGPWVNYFTSLSSDSTSVK